MTYLLLSVHISRNNQHLEYSLERRDDVKKKRILCMLPTVLTMIYLFHIFVPLVISDNSLRVAFVT